jgi:hypothetical protein
LNGAISAFVTMPNGDLVAGGAFTTAGGVHCYYIARWNGTAWSPLGSGMNNGVLGLAVRPNGDLIAGGFFTTAGGVACSYIARWNGSAWSPLGTGVNNAVWSLASMPNGDVVAGGDFLLAGGVPCASIARWNGAAWSTLGTGVDLPVTSLTPLPGNGLVAGGTFQTAGGIAAARIATWNGATWAPMGPGLSDTVEALAVLPNGHVIAGGRFTNAGTLSVFRIARWDGSAWSRINRTSTSYGLNGTVGALHLRPDGGLMVGGAFTFSSGSVSTQSIALYSQPLPPYFIQQPTSRTVLGGELAAFGVNASVDTAAFQWHRDGTALVDDGRITGATSSLLMIADTTTLDAGEYTCVISNPCGSATSAAATLEVVCPADFNVDGGVDGSDIDAFFAAWEAGDMSADINRDGGIDGGDVSYFFLRWEGGC